MEINYNYEIDFELVNSSKYTDWIKKIILSEQATYDNLSYVFCDDEYLSKINLEYLNHDTLTDIITFDYSDGKMISGDIFISIERLRENAVTFKVDFEEELKRVMSHGVLHLLGYKDKAKEEQLLMRTKENEKINLFHVEQ